MKKHCLHISMWPYYLPLYSTNLSFYNNR